MNNFYMNQAGLIAEDGIEQGCGGPFGCVIVKGDEVVAVSHNEVISSKDPTAHGEIVAIRKACEQLDTHILKGCTLYTTAEPCPMCLSAIQWARIDKVVYCKSIKDTEDELGFDDVYFYNQIVSRVEGKTIDVEMEQIECELVNQIFIQYANMDKEMY